MNNENLVLNFEYNKNVRFLEIEYIKIIFSLKEEGVNIKELKKIGEFYFKRILNMKNLELDVMLDIAKLKNNYEYNESDFPQKDKEEFLSIPSNYIYLKKIKVDSELDINLISSMILKSIKLLTKGLNSESWIGLKYKNNILFDLNEEKMEIDKEILIFKQAGFSKLPDVESNEIAIINEKILRKFNLTNSFISPTKKRKI